MQLILLHTLRAKYMLNFTEADTYNNHHIVNLFYVS